MVWYAHLFQNFPQFTVIHMVKDIGIVNKAEIDIFLEPSCFFHDPADSTHGHYQMVGTGIRLIIFFAAKDGEALYSQQKQDQELTVDQIMNSLVPNSD